MKRKGFAIIFALILSWAMFAGFTGLTNAWSNGGYSIDPENPDYGTHDWIAHHALDYLPVSEKQFIIDNLSIYLYGTELPDNDKAPDRINDKNKHHVYFFANGTLQDDSAAIRAQEEYEKALAYYNAGVYDLAAKHLGIMSHYIVDQAVFAHVMGVVSEWGTEEKDNHADYEEKVNSRTNTYVDTFNSYLFFDGKLSITSARDATLMLGYDSTFDFNGTKTCIWMDDNYDWSNLDIQVQAGESLNLAVNILADVLHTFSTVKTIPEFPHTFAYELLFLAILTLALTISIIKKQKPPVGH
jgi:hypothetical protein